MTREQEHQIAEEVAALKAVMQRVERQLEKAAEHREKHHSDLKDIHGRLTAIETRQRGQDVVEGEVHENTALNREQNAVSTDRERRFDNRLALVGTGLALVSLVLHVINSAPGGWQ